VARALSDHTRLGVAEVAEAALGYAARICIYTNDNINVVTLP
jgi:ATP-dependent protease HslVU (ClpYQ) peptidase subunit